MRRRCCETPDVGQEGLCPSWPSPLGGELAPQTPRGEVRGSGRDAAGAPSPREFRAPPASPDLFFPGGVRGAPPPPGGESPRGAEPLSERRHLALHLPRLPVERLRRESEPFALWGVDGPRRLVTAASAQAEAAGVHAGQALADAQAILPDLVLEPADPAGDAAFLERLALWTLRFTPLVALDPPQGLLLDVTGVAHLFGGEEALLDTVVQHLARQGLTAIAALADAPMAAAVLARAGVQRVVPPGGAAEAVAPLPLFALRLEEDLAAALHGLGLRSIGAVAAQPRAGLVRRFGAGLAAALDEAMGRRARPISPLRPPPELGVHRDFAEPIATRESIDLVVAELLDALCRKLRETGSGARRVGLSAFRVDGTVQEIAVGTGLASRDPAHLGRLFAQRLERLEPDCGYDRLALEAWQVEALAGAQSGLGLGAREARREALAELLDRLSQRVRVWRPAPRASHWPEREVARVSAFESVTVPQGWAARPRPVRLLRRPLRVTAMAEVPDGPPRLVRLGRVSHRVLRAEGPERVEPEWWRDPPERPMRDYYRVELATGARLWLCRVGFDAPGAEARWYLHGYLP